MISIHAIYANVLSNRLVFGHTIAEARVMYDAIMAGKEKPLYRVVVHPKHTRNQKDTTVHADAHHRSTVRE